MTSPLGPSDQYSTATPLVNKIKRDTQNLSGSPDDLLRIGAYGLYEDMYYNRPASFEVFIRGDDDESNKIYFPSAKKMVEAMNRFLCKDFKFVVPSGDDADGASRLQLRMENLFKRERVKAKFQNQKRMALIRGDGILFLRADPSKPQYSRISIDEMSPGNYFPIVDPANTKRVLGCHLVEVIQDPREKEDKTKKIVRRQTYLKAGVTYAAANNGYVSVPTLDTKIYYEMTHWEIGKWDDRNMKSGDLKRVNGNGITDVPLGAMPEQISSLPVYHWKNGSSDSLFGNSEISGLESLMVAVNQSITDEDLSLVMNGLGVYATTSKPPKDANGVATDWTLSPGSVVEHAKDTDFTRISGVSSVSPYQDHISKMQEAMQEGNGIPDIAAGKVDVAVAESGISLSLQLAPILASSNEKEEEVLSVLDHMLYDLATQWFPAYEQESFGEVTPNTVVGDPMPVNREARIQEVMLLFTSGLIELGQARAELAKFGYDFTKTPEEVLRAASTGNGDTDDNRFAQELEAEVRELSPTATQLPEGFQPAPAAAATAPVG